MYMVLNTQNIRGWISNFNILLASMATWSKRWPGYKMLKQHMSGALVSVIKRSSCCDTLPE